MAKITREQETMLDRVTELRETEKVTEARTRARIEREVRLEMASATQRLDEALAYAHESGVPVRRLLAAYGTSNFETVKTRILAGKSRMDDVPVQIADQTPKTMLDYLTVEQSPAYDGAWRITSREMPRSFWTFEAKDETLIPPTYSGYLDVNMDNSLVSLRGHNSDPGGPLHVEWNHKGTPIREILKGV